MGLKGALQLSFPLDKATLPAFKCVFPKERGERQEKGRARRDEEENKSGTKG
jgi:hypothetical protein